VHKNGLDVQEWDGYASILFSCYDDLDKWREGEEGTNVRCTGTGVRGDWGFRAQTLRENRSDRGMR
jgi:hypothetical protein